MNHIKLETTIFVNESRKLSFPKINPICCGREMYPCGGVFGERPDNKIGDIEHQWRCSICGKETMDILQ